MLNNLNSERMKRTKEIGYELLRIVDMDGFMELWNRTDTETKDKIVNGIGELAVKLVNGDSTSQDQALNLADVSGSLPEDICKVHGHVMYPVYKLDNTANGHTSHFGQNKCSRCGYEEDWQYDM